MSVSQEEVSAERVCEEYNAALNYAINEAERDDSSGILFLSMWREGNWDGITKEYPEFKGPFPDVLKQLPSSKHQDSIDNDIFESACTGLRYRNHSACGEVAAIHLCGIRWPIAQSIHVAIEEGE